MTDVSARSEEPATTTPAAAEPRVDRRRWFGTLFMTDVWERFAFYTMQSLLVLFVAASSAQGGFGMSTANAAALTGSWIGLTFMLGGPGGWVADRILGVRRAMQLGGGLIALGHFAVAVPSPAVNMLGLVLVSVGAGLYKPNHQALINQMYDDESQREAGISMLYMGTQLSALVAPVVAGLVSQFAGFHPAFAVSGAVMVVGVVQFTLSQRRFGSVGIAPLRPLDAKERRTARKWSWIGAVLLVLVVVLTVFGGLMALLSVYLLVSLVTPFLVYRSLYRQRTLGPADRKRLRAFTWVLGVWLVFFMIIAQGGSVILLFVDAHVNRDAFGFTIPTSWFTAVSPLFLVLLSPVFAWLLPRIRGGVPGKFAIALLLGGLSFLMMAVPAAEAATGAQVSPVWALVLFFMHSCGELLIISVAVAVVSEVLPPRYLSQMIGLLWLFAALGGGLGSQIVLLAQALPASVYFLSYGIFATALAGLMALRRRSIVAGLATPA